MKRSLIWLTVFFYISTFANPQRSHAIVPLLIPAAAIGASLMAASVGSYYAQTGQVPSYVNQTANVVASAADALFQPSYLAQGAYHLFTPDSLNVAKDYYIGKAAAVGARIGDIIDTVKDSTDSALQALKDVINSATVTDNFLKSDLSDGSTYQFSDGTKYTMEPTSNTYMAPNWVTTEAQSKPNFAIQGGYCWKTGPTSASCYDGSMYSWMLWVYGYRLIPSTNPAAEPTSTVDHDVLKGAVTNPNPDLANAIKDAIRSVPQDKRIASQAVPDTVDTASPAEALTSAQVSDILAQNALAVARAAAEAAADLATANPDDPALQIAANQAAAEAAKAEAEAAKPEPEVENFSPISASPFENAYDPGEFDIAARFTTFLDNVKTSGLFSFSSAFFNSLPGGGSSTYTINGGDTFGTHTIDLSDTLSGGLAVLKTILLACFGFLSIRAVIMKR
jgi:hypothetical protein